MDHIYKKIDLIGSSTVSVEDAIEKAVERASQTMENLDWFEVDEIRGHIEDGKIRHYQVGLKVGFRLKAKD
jgi:flavin-binding protein dodecin